MPLLDHFHPPLHGPRRCEGFHHSWATFIAQQLNQETLPPDYFAESEISVGPELEIDVAAMELSPYGCLSTLAFRCGWKRAIWRRAGHYGSRLEYGPPCGRRSEELPFAGLPACYAAGRHRITRLLKNPISVVTPLQISKLHSQTAAWATRVMPPKSAHIKRMPRRRPFQRGNACVLYGSHNATSIEV